MRWSISAESPSKELVVYILNLKNHRLKSLFKKNAYISEPYVDMPEWYFIKRRNNYLFRFDAVNRSPNFVFTSDLSKFDTLSNVYPENDYNWLTSDLLHYKDKFNKDCQAKIYKPENFDCNKEYPLIFYYYLNQSDQLNKYLSPEPDGAGINIPLLVSSGYIVVQPDIYTILGKPGESALISVLAAVNYLKDFKWADTSRMAICGHSWGGFETNYIVSHSSCFKAAYSGAGVSNYIQFYNGVWASGASQQGYAKISPGNIYEDLEKNSKPYIDNSAILNTSKIITPILLMHNDEDYQNDVGQSRQLFIQLRSENKPVWLLQYTGEGHTVEDIVKVRDLENKIKGFFDYYLKGLPEPNWMKKHISLSN